MPVRDIIKEERIPLTKEKLIKDLRKLGVARGDYLLLHASLNKLGYIIGKERSLVEALIEVVGDEGLVVMPTQSSDNSNPGNWRNPPVPKLWQEEIKQHLPAYDKDLTPCYGMGDVPEYFRKYRGVIRSDHPQVSFAAYGQRNKELLNLHPLEYGLNDDSPLGLMYQWGFKILMLGTEYDSCTAMHLAEYRAHSQEEILEECSTLVDGKREWIKFKEIDFNSNRFPEIGCEYEKTHSINKGKIGYGESRLIDLQSLIDFTTNYLSK